MAIELTQEIGRCITTVTEDSRETTFLFQRLCMALQRGNAVSFQNTMITDWSSVATALHFFLWFSCLLALCWWALKVIIIITFSKLLQGTDNVLGGCMFDTVQQCIQNGWCVGMQVVHRVPGDDNEKLTLYVQAVHRDQKMSWIKELRRGLHTYCCWCFTDRPLWINQSISTHLSQS